MIRTDGEQFIEETRQALQNVRRALIELYDAIGVNPETPQDVSRRFGINRNLTWKISRVINASDPFATLNHLPGDQGMELAVRAFEKAGAPDEMLGTVRDAMTRLREVVADHAGDREHLELTLESIGLFERDTMAESGRELAFRGNSSVWGVQAQTRWSGTFFGPGRTPETMDMVSLSGIVGFRRLRPSVEWRLHRRRLYDDKGGTLRSERVMEEFEPKGPGDVSQQIREFSSPNMPDLVVKDVAEGSEVYLPGGPVGNRGTFDIFTGGIHRGLPRYRTEQERTASRAMSITLPAKAFVFDLILHRDVIIPETPGILLNGFPYGNTEDPRAQSNRHVLPISDGLVELAGSPPAVSTPAVPRIARVVERVFNRMGWNGSEFRGLRLQVMYPPMSSVIVVQWPLPEGPMAIG
jgi:hypothetical protein